MGIMLGASCGCCALGVAEPLLGIGSSASCISTSTGMVLLLLLCFLALLGATVRVGAGAEIGGCVVGFGGPGAIATTVFTGLSAAPVLVGVVAAVPVPVEPAVDFGDSESFVEAFAELVVVVEACAIEFFLLAAFFDLVVLTGPLLPLPRLRFLITSVFRLSGRTTPCSFKNRPHALQSGWPSGLRRHNGVV